MGVQARGGERSCTGRMSSSRGIALNCGLAAPPTTTTCHTPNTPEILNAIVNISFPTPSLTRASTPFPSVQPLVPPRRGSTRCASPLPLLLGLLHTLLRQRGLPSQLPDGSELRPAHPVTVHQGGPQDEGAPEAEVGARGGSCCFRTRSWHQERI